MVKSRRFERLARLMSHGKRKSVTPLLAAFLSLLSALIAGLTSQAIDYVKATRLDRSQELSRLREKRWDESADVYRDLFSLRIQLATHLLRYREACLQMKYDETLRDQHHDQNVTTKIEEDQRNIDATSLQVVSDRVELNKLAGWILLAAPASKIRGSRTEWEEAIDALVNLELWVAPSPTPNEDLRKWVKVQALAAGNKAASETMVKFQRVLQLIKDRRKDLLETAQVVP